MLFLQSEQAQSKGIVSAVFEQSSDALLLLSEDGAVVRRANPAAHRMFAGLLDPVQGAAQWQQIKGALETASAGPLDWELLITDLALPDMDSAALTGALQDRGEVLPPVLLLSSLDTTEADRQRFAATLGKPIRPAELVTGLLLALGYDDAHAAVAQVGFDTKLDTLANFAGRKATHLLRAMDYQRPPYIIAMTANAHASDQEACLSAGMNDFIAKPVRLEELRAALERASLAGVFEDPGLI